MNGKKTEKNRSDLHSEIGVNSTAGDSRPLHTLKGIGPKTEELFRRAGIGSPMIVFPILSPI